MENTSIMICKLQVVLKKEMTRSNLGQCDRLEQGWFAQT